MTDIELNIKIRHGLTMFLDSIREYENENRSLICDDERDSLEFVDIFFESEDAFDFRDIMKSVKLSKMPEKLTAENGAKTLLIGEFHEYIDIENELYCGCGVPDCGFCKTHSDQPEYINQKVPVSWDTIKDIYKNIVSFYCT